MKRRKVLCLIMASLLLISSAVFSFAEEIEEVQNQLEKVEEQQQDIEGKIEQNEMEESEIIEMIEEIEMDIIEAEAEIEGIDLSIAQVLEDIEVSQQELTEAIIGMEDKNELLGARVATMYRKGNISYIEIILGSRNFPELLSNMDMIRKIADHDVQMIKELEEQVTLVEGKQEVLENQKKQLLGYQKDVEKRVATLQVYRGTQQHLRKEIQSTIASMEQELAEREAESAFLEGEIQRIEREIQERIEVEQKAAEERARKEAEERALKEAEENARLAAEREAKEESETEESETEESEIEESETEEPVVTPITNKSWPVPGYHRISSAYGYRTHPIFGDWRPHWGIDIPAPMGTPIVASLAGEVIISTYGPSYGNYMVIYHGEGISTLYAHNSSNHLSVGNSVEQGQVIASIGSTGNSTGPHIHFEVRVNGDPKIINPFQWLNQ